MFEFFGLLMALTGTMVGNAPSLSNTMKPSAPSFAISIFAGLLLTGSAAANTATYQLVVENTWGTATHPGAFPDLGHFSWLAGGTHNDQVSFWEVGQTTSPGMTQMAETGHTEMLRDEVAAAISAGTAGGSVHWEHWFCPSETTFSSCGDTTVTFTIDSDFPLLTLASMLGPSPDWFIGVSGLALREEGQWHDEVIVDLFPYDGGTRSANLFELGGPQNSSPQPISPITAASGQLVGPQQMGTFTFTLLETDTPDGDLDGDGFVGSGDLDVILAHWGENVTPGDLLQGDNSGDGLVGQADLDAVLEHWGQGDPPAGGVPEPGSAALLGLGGLVLARRRRK